jgi:hypothetical protein
MTNKNNVTTFKPRDEMLDESWNRVKEALNIVATLDKVNQKPLSRTGKVMQKALIDLFTYIDAYDQLRNRK